MAVITDSGGITRSSQLWIFMYYIKRKHWTSEAVSLGTNELIGSDPTNLKPTLENCLKKWKNGKIPDLWDGRSGHRIINHISSKFLK